MRVALNLEHEGRLYVSAEVWPSYGRAPRPVLASVAYSWRTKAGAWSQSHRLVGMREEVPEVVRVAALQAGHAAYLERARQAQADAEVLRLALLGGAE